MIIYSYILSYIINYYPPIPPHSFLTSYSIFLHFILRAGGRSLLAPLVHQGQRPGPRAHGRAGGRDGGPGWSIYEKLFVSPIYSTRPYTAICCHTYLCLCI